MWVVGLILTVSKSSEKGSEGYWVVACGLWLVGNENNKRKDITGLFEYIVRLN